MLCSVAQCFTVAPLLCVWQAGGIMAYYTYLSQMALVFSAANCFSDWKWRLEWKWGQSIIWAWTEACPCNRYLCVCQGAVWGGWGGLRWVAPALWVEEGPQLAFFQLKQLPIMAVNTMPFREIVGALMAGTHSECLFWQREDIICKKLYIYIYC